MALLLALHMGNAAAAPSPRSEEWWFSAWEITKIWRMTKGAGVIVAVIDSGVEARLPDLQGVVLKGGSVGWGLHGDGRTDHDSEQGGHGTGMAALIAGQGKGTGMTGVAPDSRILPVLADQDSWPQAIRFAVDHGAKVINMSVGADTASCDPKLQNAISYAIDHDAVLVAAAGNKAGTDSEKSSPANCAGGLVVGGLDQNLGVYRNSTPGDSTAVAAPAVNVGSIGKAGVFGVVNGTSSATALTSGAIALLRSRFPDESGRRIVQRLLNTARDVGDKGWDRYTGNGAVIPYSAAVDNVPSGAPNSVYARYDRWSQGRTGKAGPQAPVQVRTPKDKSRRPGHSGIPKMLYVEIAGALLVAMAAVGVVLIGVRRGRKR
ncbi:S8 family serine peptidase [Actinomadura oligospora]|uniref:S8 family serine peptidase n=1 Tax=Actinomadura oligospora TaxID=111804 RepID=UPI001474B919|nr:S8 family serine peptidase [Actinomadura oligospora]